jgi:hypothetical protein
MWTMDCGQWTMDSGRWTVDYGQWTMDSGLWIPGQGLWTFGLGSGRDKGECAQTVEGIFNILSRIPVCAVKAAVLVL